MSPELIATIVSVVFLVITVLACRRTGWYEERMRQHAGLLPRRKWWQRPPTLPGREP